MVYVAATELTSVLPIAVTIHATSTPLSYGDVASICAEVSAELDAAAAAAGYSVPVATTVSGYAQMVGYTKTGAAARVLAVYAPNLPGGERDGIAGRYQTRFDKVLDRIAKGQIVIVGAGSDPDGGSRELGRSFETSNPGDARGGASPVLSVHQEF